MCPLAHRKRVSKGLQCFAPLLGVAQLLGRLEEIHFELLQRVHGHGISYVGVVRQHALME